MLTINQTLTEGIQILEIEGRLDVGSADQLQETVQKLLDGGANRLVIDCAGLRYISSSGLRVFITAAKRLKSEGGRLTICCMGAMIRKVFDISGLSAMMEIVGSREEAVAG